MKKILLIGYMKKNLGDDLFLSLIANRYKNYKIDIYCSKAFIEPFINAKHVKFINEDFFRNNNIDLDQYALCIYVGGSIFKETKNDLETKKWLLQFELDCKAKGIPFYFVSSNFGPYQTQEYLDVATKNIKNATKVYFREKYSYDLFKFKNVEYNPDLALSMNYKKKKEIKDTVGISLINLYSTSRGEIDNYYFEYMKFLKNNIVKYINEGKKIYLFAFCEHEGDHAAVNTLMSMIDMKYWNSIKQVYYNGNLNSFLDIYSRMEYVLCTRFHAVILSAYFNQKLIACNYSTKISHVIEDYNFKCEYIQIDDKIGDRIVELKEYKRCSVKTLCDKAKLSFKDIDNYLESSFHLEINKDYKIGGTYKRNKKSKIRSLGGRVLRKLKILKPKKKVVKEVNIEESNKSILNRIYDLKTIDNMTYNASLKALGYDYKDIKVNTVNDGPLVSVIIPTYKRTDYLSKALDSVLKQSYKNIEIIVVDDYMESDLKKFISKNYKYAKNLVYTKNPQNLKAGKSRKNGYNLSHGEYIVFLDDDDFFVDYNFIEKCVNIFEKYPKVNMVGFNSFKFVEETNEIRFRNIGYKGLCNSLDYMYSFMIEYFKPDPSFAMFRKTILEENNFKNMDMMNDGPIFLKAMKKGQMYLFNSPAGFYRIHSNNITKGLEPKFIIDNMEEKKEVYLYLKNNSLIDNVDYWWYKQNRLTMNYYINGSKPNLKNFNMVLKWSLKNMNKYKYKFAKEMIHIEMRMLKAKRRSK